MTAVYTCRHLLITKLLMFCNNLLYKQFIATFVTSQHSYYLYSGRTLLRFLLWQQHYYFQLRNFEFFLTKCQLKTNFFLIRLQVITIMITIPQSLLYVKKVCIVEFQQLQKMNGSIGCRVSYTKIQLPYFAF